MVTDTIENILLYKGLGPNIEAALKYLATTKFDEIEPGKYTVKEDDIFAIVAEYETKDKSDCEPEAHRKYIDIQYLVKGVELFGYAPLTVHIPFIDYDDEKDVAIYKEELSYLKLEAGMFIIFYPTDIHQPEVRAFEPMWVKKVVMKVRVPSI